MIIIRIPIHERRNCKLHTLQLLSLPIFLHLLHMCSYLCFHLPFFLSPLPLTSSLSIPIFFRNFNSNSIFISISSLYLSLSILQAIWLCKLLLGKLYFTASNLESITASYTFTIFQIIHLLIIYFKFITYYLFKFHIYVRKFVKLTIKSWRGKYRIYICTDVKSKSKR